MDITLTINIGGVLHNTEYYKMRSLLDHNCSEKLKFEDLHRLFVQKRLWHP